MARSSKYRGIKLKKVKRTKSLYKRRKSTFRKVSETFGLIILILGLGTIGFAAGKPLLAFLTGEKEIVTDDTLKWTPPVESEPQTEPTTTETSVSEAEPIPESVTTKKATYAPNSVLQNSATLGVFLKSAVAGGYDSVVLDFKDSNGYVWYQSRISAINGENGSVKGDMNVSQIVSLCKAENIIPIARVNTLKDHINPGLVDDMTYRFSDGSYTWLDNKKENGGKMWANPSLLGTQNFLSSLIKEIVSGGVENIVLANTVFPELKPYDISVLSSNVTDMNTRHNVLAEFINKITEDTDDVKYYFEVDLFEMVESFDGLGGSAEVLKNTNLSDKFEILALYDKSDFGTQLKINETSTVTLPSEPSELVKTLFLEGAKTANVHKLTPLIKLSGIGSTDLQKIEETLNLQYDSIFYVQ